MFNKTIKLFAYAKEIGITGRCKRYVKTAFSANKRESDKMGLDSETLLIEDILQYNNIWNDTRISSKT